MGLGRVAGESPRQSQDPNGSNMLVSKMELVRSLRKHMFT